MSGVPFKISSGFIFLKFGPVLVQNWNKNGEGSLYCLAIFSIRFETSYINANDDCRNAPRLVPIKTVDEFERRIGMCFQADGCNIEHLYSVWYLSENPIIHQNIRIAFLGWFFVRFNFYCVIVLTKTLLHYLKMQHKVKGFGLRAVYLISESNQFFFKKLVLSMLISVVT